MIGNHLRHPDVHRPWHEWSEDEILHLVGIYTNAFRWDSRREAMNDWIRHMRKAPNIVLHVVELAYGDRPFEVTGEHPNDIQVRTDCVLWHKENLINLGVRHFPNGWKHGGYCDGDFHMTRHDWGLEAIHMLQHHSFVQLISSYADLTPETSTSFSGHRPMAFNSAFAWNFHHQEDFLARKKREKAKRDLDLYYDGGPCKDIERFPFGYAPGFSGGAMAWRRDAFDMVGGMLDTCVVGGGDWHMAFGLAGLRSWEREMQAGHAYIRHILEWQERASRLDLIEGRSPLGYIDNFATHFFHGTKPNRNYSNRWKILLRHNFDPLADLTRDWQGLWRWRGNKPGLRDDLYDYFLLRAEDHPGDAKGII